MIEHCFDQFGVRSGCRFHGGGRRLGSSAFDSGWPGFFHPQKVYEIEDFLLSTPASGGQDPLLCTSTAPYALSSARTSSTFKKFAWSGR